MHVGWWWVPLVHCTCCNMNVALNVHIHFKTEHGALPPASPQGLQSCNLFFLLLLPSTARRDLAGLLNDIHMDLWYTYVAPRGVEEGRTLGLVMASWGMEAATPRGCVRPTSLQSHPPAQRPGMSSLLLLLLIYAAPQAPTSNPANQMQGANQGTVSYQI